MTTIQKTDYCEEFAKMFREGAQKLVEAAQLYVKAIDEDPTWRQKFYDAMPNIEWRNWEEVGRGTMVQELLMCPNLPIVSAIRRLPMSMQREVVGGKRYPLLIIRQAEGKEKHDEILVDLLCLGKRQRAQLFDGGRIRGLAAQRAWMEENVRVEDQPGVRLPYTISGGQIKFRANTIMTKPELRRVLQEM